ncbi:MAG TPA: deaminase [Candidatus Microsaccharimonas sp.]|jgi:deoxycytidylate deaminase
MTTNETHEQFFEEARKVAVMATCNQAHCGSIIVAQDGQIIGRGYNAPPQGDESQRMCDVEFHSDKKPNSDKTCCVHAEWSAIIDALKHHGDKIDGSTLYFMRVNDKDESTGAGVPWCTVCSRLALESGIAEFGLWQEDAGPKMFDTHTYNLESYAFYN